MEVTHTGVNGGGSEIIAAAGSGGTAVGDGTEALEDHVGTIVDGVDGVDGDTKASIGDNPALREGSIEGAGRKHLQEIVTISKEDNYNKKTYT